MSAKLKFIGHITTPYKVLKDCPSNIQFGGKVCQLNIKPEYQGELNGLESGQSILVLYWLGHSEAASPAWKSEFDGEKRGTFALRTPIRPNPIGTAVLEIEKILAGQIVIRGLDCLDGTPLLDIKPAIYREVLVDIGSLA